MIATKIAMSFADSPLRNASMKEFLMSSKKVSAEALNTIVLLRGDGVSDKGCGIAKIII